VRSELLKVRSTRLWWGLLIGVVGLSAVQAGATAGFAGVDLGAGQGTAPCLDEPETIRGVYASAAFAGAYIFALVLGITGMTGEYRYQTATPTFLASPRRSRVVLAKGVAQLGFGLLYGAIALAAAVLVGGVVIAVRGHDLGFGTPGLLRAVVLGVVAVGLWGLIGMGIGTLIRNQVAAIMVGVFVTFLLEPLLSLGLDALELGKVAQWLPTNASAALTSPSETTIELLDWWAGGLVMAGYAVLFAALGVLLSVRRDVS
jgi:ABC-type transport system involved in multi-copper enzyme maturation permease subunit